MRDNKIFTKDEKEKAETALYILNCFFHRYDAGSSHIDSALDSLSNEMSYICSEEYDAEETEDE